MLRLRVEDLPRFRDAIIPSGSGSCSQPWCTFGFVGSVGFHDLGFRDVQGLSVVFRCRLGCVIQSGHHNQGLVRFAL